MTTRSDDLSTDSVDTASTIESVQRLLTEFRTKNEAKVNKARSIDLPGVKRLAHNAAEVSSSEVFKNGWSARSFIVDHQIDHLLDALRAGRRSEVRDLVQWLDEDAEGHAPPHRSLPLELHPDVARAVAQPVREWLAMTNVIRADAATDETPSVPRAQRRPGMR